MCNNELKIRQELGGKTNLLSHIMGIIMNIDLGAHIKLKIIYLSIK